MSIIAAVIIFSVIVLFHEFGHFIAARLNKVQVLEFSLGMGPRLISHVSRGSGTRYSVKILPFGGSCMPLFNFILAFLFAVIIISSVGYDAPVAELLTDQSPLAEAGVAAGDEITSIDGKKITVYRDIVNYVTFDLSVKKQPVTVPVEWKHEGKTMSSDVSLNPAGTLGIYGGGRFSAHGDVPLILRYSLYEVKYWIVTTLSSLKMIGMGRVSIDDVSGPVGIVGAISDTYKETRSEGTLILIMNMLNMAILLSANLGVMNLIPFPALDGGRILLLIIEGIRKKKLGENIEAYINLAGFAVLMCVMVLVMFNDIRKLI